jgi:hypothetical protein
MEKLGASAILQSFTSSSTLRNLSCSAAEHRSPLISCMRLCHRLRLRLRDPQKPFRSRPRGQLLAKSRAGGRTLQQQTSIVQSHTSHFEPKITRLRYSKKQDQAPALYSKCEHLETRLRSSLNTTTRRPPPPNHQKTHNAPTLTCDKENASAPQSPAPASSSLGGSDLMDSSPRAEEDITTSRRRTARSPHPRPPRTATASPARAGG